MKRNIRKIVSVLLVLAMLLVDFPSEYYAKGIITAYGATQEKQEYTDYLSKAEELGTPLAIYNYLRNNINYEYYGGVRKGSEAVYDSLGGNDVEQAVLLSEMLNAVGYDTRYVRGLVRFTEEEAIHITGASDIMAAADIMALTGYPVTVCYDNSGTAQYIETEHTWVEAYVPYGDYRGNGNNSGEYYWIPLDTGIKQYETVETIYEHYDELGITKENMMSVLEATADALETTADATQDALLPTAATSDAAVKMEMYVTQLCEAMSSEEYAELYLTRRRIAKQELNYLPLSLQYEVVEEYEKSDNLPESLYDSITFILNGDISVTLKSCELYNKRLTLTYEAAENGAIVSQLQLDGNVLCEGMPVTPGSDEIFIMTVNSGGQSQIIENDIIAGGIYQITTDAQNITARELNDAFDRLTGASKKADIHNVMEEEYLGVLLDYVGKSYFAQIDVADRIVAEQMNVTEVRSLSVGMTGYMPIVQDINGVRTMADTGSLYIDIDMDAHRAASNVGDADSIKQYMMAAGIISSVYESVIWEEITGTPSVSTMSVLAEAVEENVDIVMINSSNLESIETQLALPESAYSHIREAVLSGKTVITTTEEVSVGDWSGAGYIVLDMETYAGEYMISGRVAINGGVNGVIISAAYVLDIILAVLDFAEALLMTPGVLTLLSIGGPIGWIGGAVLGCVIASFMAMAVQMYIDSIMLMSDYMEGDEDAGDELVFNSMVGLASIALVKGAGILSKTIVTKTVTKKIAGILGDEAAAVLINGSSNPGKLIKYISKLESAGISDRVISQMALNLETESFEKLGKLATKGMSSDFLLQLAANEAVLNQVLDETAFLVFKGTTHSAEDIVRLVGENGGDFIRLYTAHGDDVAEAILKCGSEAITDIDTYKDGFLDLVRFYGDEFSELYRKYGHDVTEKGILYGEEFFMLVEEYGEDCAEVIIRYGDEAMDAVRRLGDDFLVQYRNYGEQFVEDFIQYGDDAVEAYVEYGDKAGEVLAGSGSKTGTVWDNITSTADNMPDTEIPATFKIDLDGNINYVNPETGTNTLWTNSNATKHMGEYVSRFGEESWSIGTRSQAILESYSASLNKAMETIGTETPGRYFGTYGNWELGINTETGVVYHARMLN